MRWQCCSADQGSSVAPPEGIGPGEGRARGGEGRGGEGVQFSTGPFLYLVKTYMVLCSNPLGNYSNLLGNCSNPFGNCSNPSSNCIDPLGNCAIPIGYVIVVIPW